MDGGLYLRFSPFWYFLGIPESFSCMLLWYSPAYISTLDFPTSVLSLKTFFASFAPSSLCYPPYTTYTSYTTLSQHTVSVAQPDPHQPIIIPQLQHHLSESPRPPPSLPAPLPLPHSTLQPRQHAFPNQPTRINHGPHLLARRRRNRPSQSPPETLPLRPPLINIAAQHNPHLLLWPLRRPPAARSPRHVRHLRCVPGESRA